MSARAVVLALAFAAIALGIFARVHALDRKLLWQDEAYSLLRVSGHTNNDVDALYDGRVHPASAVFALQSVTPERGLGALFASIAREEPQRGPLYYALARLWIGVAGNGTAAVRGLSVLLGIAGIALAFAFGRRAAGSFEGGAFAGALYALAPLQIRLAQQVREYVLVSDLTLLSGLLVLRAAEKPSASRWAAWALCGIAGLYTNVEFAFVLVFEAAAVSWFAFHSEARARRDMLAGCGLALAVAALAYAPWLRAISGAATLGAGGVSWAASSYSLRSSTLKWAFNVGASFFDSEYANVPLGVALLPAFGVTAFALYRLAKGPGDGFVRALALALVASTALPLTVLDALRHSHYALVTRYAMSSWTGLESAVAIALAWQIASPDARARRFSASAFAFLIVLGAAAFVLDRPYVEWWDDNEHLSERAVADAVAAHPDVPIVAGSDTAAYVLVLSRYLEPGHPLMLLNGSSFPFSLEKPTYYLFLPSATLRAGALAAAGGQRVRLQNISPPIGLEIPDLRDRSDPQVAAANALWALDVR